MTAEKTKKSTPLPEVNIKNLREDLEVDKDHILCLEADIENLESRVLALETLLIKFLKGAVTSVNSLYKCDLNVVIEPKDLES